MIINSMYTHEIMFILIPINRTCDNIIVYDYSYCAKQLILEQQCIYKRTTNTFSYYFAIFYHVHEICTDMHIYLILATVKKLRLISLNIRILIQIQYNNNII